MSKSPPAFLVVAALAVSASCLFANDLKSVIIPQGGMRSIAVANNDVLKIRNFTQEGGATRGIVTVTISGVSTNVLAATIIETSASATATPTPTSTPTPTPSPTPPALEVINQVTIAGPATVTVTCPNDATSCFISFRKGNNDDSD